MPDMRRYKVRESKFSGKSRVWSAVVLMAIGISVLGAYSFASQDKAHAQMMVPRENTLIRTTPDAPSEVPPPVAQGK